MASGNVTQKLCAHCESLSLAKLEPYLNGPGNGAKGTGYVLYQSSKELGISAKGCAMCATIEQSLLHALNGSKLPSSLLDGGRRSLDTGVVTIEPKADTIGKAFPYDVGDGLYLSGLVVKTHQRSGDSLVPLRGKVRLYLHSEDPDFQANADLVGRPRISHPASQAALALMRDWLSGCYRQHKPCCRTMSGGVVDGKHLPELPTRIMAIGDTSIRLVHAVGTRGQYAALSHCWGPQDRRPLSTTKQSLSLFLTNIGFDQLPKSFRDAVSVARGLGLRWLWIDSLCIVQDDEDDWEKQSQMMGAIFENAEVTFAASHSDDSWQGFLLPRTVDPSPVHLPGLTPAEGEAQVKAMATLRFESIHDTFPEHGILNQRAWATQEWLLSRRMVFFTKGALIWSCKEITQRETGERCYNISRNLTWTVVVESYSERKLTFGKDRIMALEGLRRELGKKTGYRYLLGIWKEALPNQLLWQVTEHQDGSNVLGLPSWTWMRVPCGVRFLLTHKAKSLISNVVISDPPRELSFRSWIKEASIVTSLPPSEAPDLLSAWDKDMVSSNVKETSKMARFLCDQQGKLLGWLVLDTEHNDSITQRLSVAALMGGLLRRDEETERRTGRIVSNKLRHYWVIALKGGDDGTYVRVGVGKTYGRGWWQDAVLETITIT